jgi:hypothetical protein
MGGLLSTSTTAIPTSVKRVALVGLTETGKSHFLSVLCGDGTEVLTPTFGLDRVQYRLGRGKAVKFVEFGWSVLRHDNDNDEIIIGHSNRGESEPFDSVVWFIDEHDTLIDVQEARSALLAFLETQPTGYLPLCIVINKGRPRTRRRIIEHGRWSSRPDEQPPERIVNWVSLPEFVDMSSLGRHFGGAVYATELSYRDPQAAALCLDWIMDATTRV